MNPDEIREKFNSITVWKRGGERAPHKPLLALYAIGRALRGEPPMVPYAQVDLDLGKLLMEFGPRRQSYARAELSLMMERKYPKLGFVQVVVYAEEVSKT